jgi:hypothetical protein
MVLEQVLVFMVWFMVFVVSLCRQSSFPVQPLDATVPHTRSACCTQELKAWLMPSRNLWENCHSPLASVIAMREFHALCVKITH